MYSGVFLVDINCAIRRKSRTPLAGFRLFFISTGRFRRRISNNDRVIFRPFITILTRYAKKGRFFGCKRAAP